MLDKLPLNITKILCWMLFVVVAMPQTFITSSSAASGGKDGDMTGTMRAGDLEALRQYKRKKANVSSNFDDDDVCRVFVDVLWCLLFVPVYYP